MPVTEMIHGKSGPGWLSVPVSQVEELKKFNRMIAAAERNMVVLKPVVK